MLLLTSHNVFVPKRQRSAINLSKLTRGPAPARLRPQEAGEGSLARGRGLLARASRR
eukprot:COSAG02_NODE_46750_length_346_cov_1.036437_1_plen_56_part_10